MMIKKDDWRLDGQEVYLKDAILKYSKFNAKKYGHNHAHCQFCFATFMEIEDPEILNWGYCTLYRKKSECWICEKCFNDFKDIFNWKVVVDKEL